MAYAPSSLRVLNYLTRSRSSRILYFTAVSLSIGPSTSLCQVFALFKYKTQSASITDSSFCFHLTDCSACCYPCPLPQQHEYHSPARVVSILSALPLMTGLVPTYTAAPDALHTHRRAAPLGAFAPANYLSLNQLLAFFKSLTRCLECSDMNI